MFEKVVTMFTSMGILKKKKILLEYMREFVQLFWTVKPNQMFSISKINKDNVCETNKIMILVPP